MLLSLPSDIPSISCCPDNLGNPGLNHFQERGASSKTESRKQPVASVTLVNSLSVSFVFNVTHETRHFFVSFFRNIPPVTKVNAPYVTFYCTPVFVSLLFFILLFKLRKQVIIIVSSCHVLLEIMCHNAIFFCNVDCLLKHLQANRHRTQYFRMKHCINLCVTLKNFVPLSLHQYENVDLIYSVVFFNNVLGHALCTTCWIS